MFDIGVSLSPAKTDFGPLLFSGNLDKGLEVAADLGYQGVELSMLDSKKIDTAWLLDKLKKLNLKVFSLATGQSYYTDGYSLFNHDKDSRRKTLERLKGHIDLASKLNAMVIVGGIRGKLQGSMADRKLQEAEGKLLLKQCVEYAGDNNVTLLIEPINRFETNLINTLQEGVELIEEIGLKNLKLLPDTFHMNIEEKSIEESLIKTKSYIKYIHFADSNRLAPGSGHIDFKSIISTLRKIGYRDAIGIEILPEPDDLSAAKKSIEFFKSINL
ncbi:MAG: sugar phosphate isomerase/epimerase family protein [Actinomycetota bacterium]